MNRPVRIVFFLLLTLLVVVSAIADPLSDAFVALDRHDYATALRLLRPLAEKGNAEAQCQLGLMYFDGEGVPKDATEGTKWVLRAAEQGHEGAQWYAGGSYMRGRGVPEDPVEAAKWYRRSADQGYAIGQAELATCYLMGLGVPRDNVQAYMWFQLASTRFSASEQHRVQIAIDNRDYAAASMTPEQIAEAQRLAREWKPKPEKPVKK